MSGIMPDIEIPLTVKDLINKNKSQLDYMIKQGITFIRANRCFSHIFSNLTHIDVQAE